MRNTVTILLTCLVSVGAYFLITYRLSSSSVFADDFARDLYDILDITRGKLTLLGPSLSFGGLRAGPYYYYLFAPIFALSRADINSVLYFNAGLFAAALGYFYYKLAPRVGSVRGLAAVGIIALSPVYLYGARTPSNGFSFLPLLFIFLIQIMIKDNFSLRGLLLLGILGGVVVNFHFVTLPLFAVLFLVILRQLKDKLKILFFTLGFGLTFLPLLFFEVRHNFVMTRTTLSLKDAWLENRNLRDLPDSILPDKYIPNNFFIILGQTKRWLAVEPLILFGLGGLFIWTERKRTRTGVMFLSCVGIFFLLAIIMRYQFSPHYLIPYAFLLIFTFVVLHAKSKWVFLVFTLIITAEIFSFPRQLFLPSASTPERFKRGVDLAIANQMVDRSVPLNVLRLVNRKNNVTLGYEYRYFFKLEGYNLNSIYEYNTARTLLVFSDLKETNINKVASWEIDQFGREYTKEAEELKLDLLTIIKLEK